MSGVVRVHWGPVLYCTREPLAHLQFEAQGFIACRRRCSKPVSALDVCKFKAGDVQRTTFAALGASGFLVLGADASHPN